MGGFFEVPGDFKSIQDAINHANPGATIYLKEGTYVENLTIGGKFIRITGEARDLVTIQAETSNPVIAVVDDGTLWLENVTLDGDGGSIGVQLGDSGTPSSAPDCQFNYVKMQNVTNGLEIHWAVERLIILNCYWSVANSGVINNSGTTVEKVRIILSEISSSSTIDDVLSLQYFRYSYISGNILSGGNYAINESGGPNIITENFSIGAAQISPFNITGTNSISDNNVVV